MYPSEFNLHTSPIYDKNNILLQRGRGAKITFKIGVAHFREEKKETFLITNTPFLCPPPQKKEKKNPNKKITFKAKYYIIRIEHDFLKIILHFNEKLALTSIQNY